MASETTKDPPHRTLVHKVECKELRSGEEGGQNKTVLYGMKNYKPELQAADSVVK
jgi:hypothetical protein